MPCCRILISQTKRIVNRLITMSSRQMSMTSAHGAYPAIVKSLNDKREYRLITLNNGLRALLVSDLTGTADEDLAIIQDCTVESESESDEADSECSEESDHSEDEKVGKGLDSAREGEKKSAAALCIGVGSFSDPDDIPGFAHFLEHMVFMGSEKYPMENDFDYYINKYGGSTNAMTDCERTFFHFDVERKHFRKSLDRFANFFVSPCLQHDSVDREIQAVDSEFQMAIQQDDNRLYQILSSCAKPGHPMGKFMWGNIDTLKHVPEKNNSNIYEKLRGFCNRMYSAHYMTLAVQSKDTLDTLETMVRESFSGIPNNQMKQPDFSICKDPFDTDTFRKWYKVVPVENINKLEIMWALPPLLDCYRVKPLDYIAALMAHEGKGSILSYLKKKNWALRLTGGNDGGGYEMNSTWSAFSLSLTLTDQGLEHVENVCGVIFEYLSMLKSEGVQKWVFEELKQIEQSKFRWKEQDEPVEYVEKVCEYMQLYPPEDFLTGCYLFFDYDEQLIQRCISHLQPDNCNIMVLSTTFKQTETCDQKEKWFGTKYSVSEIPQHLLNKWKNPDLNPSLHLPVRNCFIATDFNVGECSGDDGSLYPKVTMQNDKCMLHYKRDEKFKVPKGYVNVHLMSPVAYRSLESYSDMATQHVLATRLKADNCINNTVENGAQHYKVCMTLLDLYINILQQNLTEDIYPAQMAGYEYTLDGLQTGMQVQIEGFNHKLPLVAEMVFKHITDFNCSIDMFEAMRTEMKKVYYNEMIKPYELARAMRFSIIMKTCWPVQERYNIIAKITKENLEQFVQEFVSSVFIEALVIGNFSGHEAEDICYQITRKFTGPSVPANMQFKELLLELPVQQTYCQVNNINPEDNNSCVTNYYQSTSGDIRSCCLNELLQLTGKHQTVLVISPLRALMLDQQAIMKTHSIKAQCIVKDMPKESIQDIKNGNVDVILASPEAIMKKEWLQIVHQEPLWSQLCLLAFDEAHCISQWGLDFRPEYRKVAELVTHFQHIPSLLLTATATEKVEKDLRTLLALPAGDTHTIARLPDRPNIYIHMEKCSEKYEEVLAWLPQHVMSRKEKSQKIVVYCKSMRDCQNIFMWLMEDLAENAYKDKQPASNNRLVEMFHSRTDNESVTRILEDFVKLQGSIRVLISTVAFGIGIQVEDIDVVVHWGVENSVLSYWQEVGRCSRDGRKGLGICYIFPRSLSRCSDEYMKKLCNTSDCLRRCVLEQFLLSNMDQSSLPSSRMCTQEDCDWCECKACMCCVNCIDRCGCAGKRVNVIDRL